MSDDDDRLDQLAAALNVGGWLPRRPRAIEPVPAAGYQGSLRGRRVVVGKSGWGWRTDLRADDPVDERGQPMVPVLDEGQWYRSEFEQIEVFAPLVPIGHVWVEQEQDIDPPADVPGSPPLLDRLVDLDTPPVRFPLPARDVPLLTGRRLVLANPERDRRAIRAISEPYVRDDGDLCVRVVDEAQWYRWATDGIPPTGATCGIHLLWVET